jgi:elongation factor G
VETCAVVVNAATGIEHGTVRLMEHAKARRLCRLLIVNKIDHADIDLELLVEQLRDTFGSECLPINLPAKGGSAGGGLLLQSRGRGRFSAVWRRAPAHHRPGGGDQRERDGPLSGGRRKGLSGQELHDAFEQCLREGHLVPICFVSARSGAGVKELLDLFERLLPHPGEANPPLFVKGSGSDAEPIRSEA